MRHYQLFNLCTRRQQLIVSAEKYQLKPKLILSSRLSLDVFFILASWCQFALKVGFHKGHQCMVGVDISSWM